MSSQPDDPQRMQQPMIARWDPARTIFLRSWRHWALMMIVLEELAHHQQVQRQRFLLWSLLSKIE